MRIKMVKCILQLLIVTISFLYSYSVYSQSIDLYWNGKSDPECPRCYRPDDRCVPGIHCALQGYYHCKPHNPPLIRDNDPQLFALIKQGQCTYVDNNQMSPTENQYTNRVGVCNSLSQIAGIDSDALSYNQLSFTLKFIQDHSSYDLQKNNQIIKAIYVDNGIATQLNRQAATNIYLQQANNADAFAQYALGVRNLAGTSAQPDLNAAISWFNKVIANPSTQESDQLMIFCAKMLMDRINQSQHSRQH